MNILSFKQFENSRFDDEILFDDVKDIFQDLIDEYHIEKIPIAGILPEGISYRTEFVPGWTDTDNNIHNDFLKIELYVHSRNANTKREYLSIFENTIKNDLENFYTRCSQMGFRTITNTKITLYNSGPLSIKCFKN